MKSRILSVLAVTGLVVAVSTDAVAQTPTLYVRVGPANPPARSAMANSANVPVMQVELTAVGANITVESLDVYFSGGGVFGEVTSCGLWEDADNDGFANTPPDVNLVNIVSPYPLATPPYWTILGSGKGKIITTIVKDTTERWLVTFSFGSTVSVGQTYGATLYNQVGVRESFSATYNPGAGPIPADVVLEPGVLQLSSNLITIANSSPSVAEPVPGGVSADQFVMICPSITPSPVGGFAQIESQLGPPGPSGTWRMFRYNEATGIYNEYGEAGFPATMDVRYGWWFISRRAANLRFQGTTTQGTPTFALAALPAGVWVQIGNPYNADMPLSYIDVQQAAGVAPLNAAGNARTSRQLYRYDGGGYVAETAAMQSCTGYWVYVITGTTLTFNRPPNALKPGETLSQERALYAGEASPPAPPSLGGGGGGSGGGACFAAVAGGIAGTALLAGLGAAGLAALLRRRPR